ncbi:MAG: N-6 DNA methylase [Saprospiraceae bacterium]
MIDKSNFKALLEHLNFEKNGKVYTKDFGHNEAYLKVDFDKKQLVYPEDKGFVINERQTCNFSSNENFVVFECVYRLLEKGYKPEHIELEPKWKVGRGASGGRADILIYNQEKKPLLLIECKTFDKEFKKAWKEMESDGGQLFSYAQQIQQTEFLCLYASSFDTKNQEIIVQQRVVSHTDNPKIISQLSNKIKVKSFKEAANLKQRFQVWKEVYQSESTESGIFEDNMLPYQIGKSKYTLADDTKPLTSEDKKGKYHLFRTILRQHNIARRETAFEVLINLFLCKIVDEEENPTDLKFRWKGIAYDNYYDFVDRLQELYKIGMNKFLKEEITYVSNKEIDDAFWTVKNDRNATKKTIQDYFRQLKFFSNNAFSFISINNEKQFIRNVKVLVDILKMWETLRLKSDKQDQFLGDMFEYFLDNSIKQSEGQFFTPLPICKFIVMSLPLETMIQQTNEPLKAIDYACGAGHFLTEYGHQIKPLVEQYKTVEPSVYYQNIVGIEKEDRLAKVAKVAAYMHQQNDIQIIENDALDNLSEIKQNSFDVLVANPPFAVKGFLQTLDEEQQETYDLLKTTELNSNTNNIQCFFLERVKQLLSPNGVVGVVVPSSILSNSDNTHVVTREIILQHFDIVSLVELGSNTFGKTGTNTVVLFLRRKGQNPSQAEHFYNRSLDFFEGIKSGDAALNEYRDLHFIQQYCNHIEVAYEDYKAFLNIQQETANSRGVLLKRLYDTYDIFKDYKTHFDKSTDIKNLKKKKHYKDLSAADKTELLNKRFINYLMTIERDKLYYFMLALSNPQQVLIVKTPSDNKSAKKFLGYEWSGSKGSEGIKYYGGETVYDITTPMFDPNNPQNTEKINYLIQQNFNGTPVADLPDTCTYADLTDMLDFSRVDFNKALMLSPKRKIKIETKWEIVKLEEIVKVLIGGTPPRKNQSYFEGNNLWVSISEMNGQIITSTKEKITEEAIKKSNVKLIPKGTTLLSFKLSIGKVAIAGTDLYTNEAIAGLIPIKSNILDNYLFQLFKANFIDLNLMGNKAFGKSLNSKILRERVKIPLPPLNIQQKIVEECEVIDNQVAAAEAEVLKGKAEIEEMVSSVNSDSYKLIDLTTKIGSGATPRGGENAYKESGITLIRSQNVYDGYFLTKGLAFIDEVQAKKLDNVTVKSGDVLLNITGASVARCCVVEDKYLPARVNQHVAIIRPNEKIHSKYLQSILVSKAYKDQLLTIAGTSATREALTKDQIQNFKIPVPSLETQATLLKAIEKIEARIKASETIIASASDEKAAVMKKYL